MKKILAMILALMMALTCVSAFADSFYTKINVDADVAQELLTGFGMPEEQLALINPVVSLINALGFKVTTVADGAQIDLDLNGADALTLGFATDAQGATVVSTLFPSYALTISKETMDQFMSQMAASMPTGSGEGGMDPNAFIEVFGSYFQRWFEACAAAGKPGDPVTGDYEFEGHTFDTMVPITVDMDAIADATKTMMDEIMADPAAMGMIQGFVQNSMQQSGQTFDAEAFPEQMKAGFDEFIAHFPKTVTSEFYTNSDGSEAFYMTGESIMEGEETPYMTYAMLFENATNMEMGCQINAEAPMEMSFTMHDNAMTMSLNMNGMFFGLSFESQDNQFACDFYLMNMDKPLVSLTVETAQGGERTLPVDAEGKTVMAAEEFMSDANSEAAQGFFGDIMSNGLMSVIGVLAEQVPEAMGLLMGDSSMAG